MRLTSRYLTWCAVLLVCSGSVRASERVEGVPPLLLRDEGVSPSKRGQDARDTQGQDALATTELKLIGVLQSDAPAAEKAITCKRLSVYGTKDAVPALAPLLLNKELSSWARTALEVIPGPEADAALREALGKAQGGLLIGAINSIAVRRDAQAVGGLVTKLADTDVDVASAAAVALGHIGGEQAALALVQSLAQTPALVRPAVAEGCILCAERFLAEGKSAESVKLYDTVRKATLPKQKLLEATRGAILARGADGIPLLVEQLQSADKAQFGIGLRTARELAGRDVTVALAVELERLSPDRRPLLLLALADRSDTAVLPVVVRAARSGSKELRVTALGVLMRLGNVSCVPVLLDAAVDNDADVAQAAQLTLTHLGRQDVDADLLARLPQATGKTRQVLIVLAGQRQIDGAVPALMASLADADAGVRSAAVQAVGAMGGDKQVADLATLLQKAQNAAERADIERALLAISGRSGASCVPSLLPLAQNSDAAIRTIGLHALAVAGGPGALAAVKSALGDKDEAVQDEAARTLSTWPNNWPDDTAAAEVLLALAKSGTKMSHQVLGLRGYLQYVRGDKSLNPGAKVAKVNDLLPLIQRPEEKRLAIGLVGAVRTAGSLELLTKMASDSAVAEDACSAIINLMSRNIPGASKEQRQKALQTVVEKSKNDATRKKAEDGLKGIR